MSWLTEGMTEAQKENSIAAERTRFSWGWYPDRLLDGRDVLVHIERRTAPTTHVPFRKRDDGEWELLVNAYEQTYIDCDEEGYREAKERAINTPDEWVLVKDAFDADDYGSGFAVWLIAQLEAMNAMTQAEWRTSEYGEPYNRFGSSPSMT